jgi:hypothetical protein
MPNFPIWDRPDFTLSFPFADQGRKFAQISRLKKFSYFKSFPTAEIRQSG